MAFKKNARSLDFADLALAICLEQTRSIQLGQRNENPIENTVIARGLRG